MFTTPAELSLRFARQRQSDDREKAGRRRLAQDVSRDGRSSTDPIAVGRYGR
jgi:hypothetical protein